MRCSCTTRRNKAVVDSCSFWNGNWGRFSEWTTKHSGRTNKRTAKTITYYIENIEQWFERNLNRKLRLCTRVTTCKGNIHILKARPSTVSPATIKPIRLWRYGRGFAMSSFSHQSLNLEISEHVCIFKITQVIMYSNTLLVRVTGSANTFAS